MKQTLKLMLYISMIVQLFFACKKQSDVKAPSETLKEKAAVNKEFACFLHLPPELMKQNKTGNPQTEGVILNAYRWQPGETIRIKFLNGSAYVQQKVRQYADQWTQHANLKFQYVSSAENADIKIGFDYGGYGGHWCYYGTLCRQIAQNDASMHFTGFSEYTSDAEYSRVVLHEFGHALSLGHEQSHPENTIQWNKPYVYTYYRQVYFWTEQMVDDNVFYRFSTAETNYSAYDPSSIMHYPIPPSFTLNGYSVGDNYVLSSTDKAFIEQMYPFPPSNKYILYGGEQLLHNQALKSQNGVYTLLMQGDGNLVLYKYGSIPLWSSNTAGTPATKCVMQTDGHLVLYDDSWNYYWYSGTYGYYGAFLAMQDDGNVVIYQNGVPLWWSNTAGL